MNLIIIFTEHSANGNNIMAIPLETSIIRMYHNKLSYYNDTEEVVLATYNSSNYKWLYDGKEYTQFEINYDD